MNMTEKNTDELKILRKIDNNPQFNQRDLAEKVGFSLGKLNYCLKSLRNKGHIKIENFKKNKNKINYFYILTAKGITKKLNLTLVFMKKKMSEYEELKNELEKKNGF